MIVILSIMSQRLRRNRNCFNSEQVQEFVSLFSIHCHHTFQLKLKKTPRASIHSVPVGSVEIVEVEVPVVSVEIVKAEVPVGSVEIVKAEVEVPVGSKNM